MLYGVKPDSSSVGHRPVAEYCEYGDEPSGSKKYENFLTPGYVWPLVQVLIAMELVQYGCLQCEEPSDCLFVTTVNVHQVDEVWTNKEEHIG